MSKLNEFSVGRFLLGAIIIGMLYLLILAVTLPAIINERGIEHTVDLMDQQPIEENDKRFEVVREIVMTEKQYCVNLDFVIKVSPSC